jgi:protein involved in polysaccharide export with SLBB domain
LISLIFFSALLSYAQVAEYPVSIGDTLYISVWGHQELSGVMTVGPDGTIAFPPPIGNIYVNQLTAKEISDILTQKLEEYIKQPVVLVSVREFQGFMVHILGQVKFPGFYRVPDGTSVQELVTQAQGFTDLADISSIILIRKDDETVQKIGIDLAKFLAENDMANNPTLKAGDVVLIPRIDIKERVKKLVTVMGYVSNPGTYELEDPLSLMDVLTLAGGILNDADLSSIFILSRTKKDEDISQKVNMESVFSREKSLTSLGPTVYPGDIVFVPGIDGFIKRQIIVNVAGQVNNPGFYNINEGERMVDAIFKSGGITQDASIENIIVIHTEYNDSPISVYSLKNYILEGDLKNNPVMRSGDTVVVPMIKILKEVPPIQTAFSPTITVSVIGQVSEPGTYRIHAGLNLLDALTIAGGPNAEANLKKILVTRGEDPENRQRIKVNLEQIIDEKNTDPFFILSDGDTVFVPKFDERENWWRSLVQIVGDISSIVVLYYLITGKRYR